MKDCSRSFSIQPFPGLVVQAPVMAFNLIACDDGSLAAKAIGDETDWLLLRWLKGWNFPQALEVVDAALGGVALPKPALPVKAAPRKTASEDAQIRPRLAETWAQSKQWRDALPQPLRDCLAHRGLGIGVLQGVEAICFHPGLRYHDEDGRYGGTFPVMLARVSDGHGKPVTFHRTYLTEAGRKAPLENPKRMMPVPSGQPVSGCAIRLGVAGPVIDLAEGIETALAARQATGLAVWSAVSATLLTGFEPPPGTRKLESGVILTARA